MKLLDTDNSPIREEEIDALMLADGVITDDVDTAERIAATHSGVVVEFHDGFFDAAGGYLVGLA